MSAWLFQSTSIRHGKSSLLREGRSEERSLDTRWRSKARVLHSAHRPWKLACSSQTCRSVNISNFPAVHGVLKKVRRWVHVLQWTSILTRWTVSLHDYGSYVCWYDSGWQLNEPVLTFCEYATMGMFWENFHLVDGLSVCAGLLRCGKSCRLRWTNYLRPDIKRGRFSIEEEQMIVHLHAILGNRWSAIATHLPMRTDNEIKNYWNTHLKKRLSQMGVDPVTHKATSNLLLNGTDLKPMASSKLSHMSQWDCARMEAEARLSKKSSATRSYSSLELNTEQLESNPFMRSWESQVTQTRRPGFGLVEMESTTQCPVDYQRFLQDWESALQDQTINNVSFGSMQSESSVSEVDFSMQSSLHEGLDNPGVSSLMLHTLNSSGSKPSFSSKSKLAEMLPTSIPCSLESQASPCGSSATDSILQNQSTYDFPLDCLQSGHPYQEFGLDRLQTGSIDLSSASPISVFPKAEAGDHNQSNFWHGHPASMMELLKSEEIDLPTGDLAASSSSSFELSQAEIGACLSPETSSTVSHCLNSSLLPQLDFLIDLESREPPLPKLDFHSSTQNFAQSSAESVPQFGSLCRQQSANFGTSFSSITPFRRMHF